MDTTAVILITHFYAHALPITPDRPLLNQLLVFIVTGHVFKLVMAMLDTVPFIIGRSSSRFLRLPPPGSTIQIHTDSPSST
ncbi:MAG: hypothetical protein R3B67_07840 [Phycisphaerales bacterium]